jgi:DNA-binding transcriptional LysR family regulator
VNLRSIDLNLLVIFDALMTENSITRAARTIGMTPSAVSHALQRLRQTFGDPLFERTQTGMRPTRRARELVGFVRAALHNLQHGISQQLEFDPATSSRSFSIRQSPFMSDCLMPRLCARVRAEAPGVRLIVGQLPEDEDAYEAGDLQIRVAARMHGRDFRRQRIWRDSFVLAMRNDHPAAARKLTQEEFLELPFLDVATAIIDRRTLDEVLRSKGLARRTMVTIPTLAGVIAVLEHTDLCAILPRRWVMLYSAPNALATVPLPLDGIEYAVDMVWHSSDERDLGHRWLRRLIAQEFEVLFAPEKRGKRRVHYPPSRLDISPPLAAAAE